MKRIFNDNSFKINNFAINTPSDSLSFCLAILLIFIVIFLIILVGIILFPICIIWDIVRLVKHIIKKWSELV